MTTITDAQWRFYLDNGYVKIGQIASDDQLAALRQRIDDIMLGTACIDYDKMLMQLDAGSDNYGDLSEQTKGHKGATLNYRKIEELEFDPLFLRYMQHPVFQNVCARVYGPGASIAVHRAMFMNKPAHSGTVLPWHQDVWTTTFDPAPRLTVWTALDPATIANGCVEIIPASHKLGIVNPNHSSGFLEKQHVEKHCDGAESIFLELQPGETALLDNLTLHRSGVNKTDIPRRGFSVNYMDASTRILQGRPSYSVVIGQGALVAEKLQTVRT